MSHNINKYRKALIYTEELGKLKILMEKALIDLEPFKKYIPAQESIEVISRNLVIVEVHLNHQKKIVETKGKEHG